MVDNQNNGYTDRSTAWWRDSAAAFGIGIMDSSIGGDRDWNDMLANGRRELRQAQALTGMQTGKDCVAVEIGCGFGRLTFALADHYRQVVGIDVCREFIEHAQTMNQKDNVTFELGDGRTIVPQEVTCADVVFACEVIHHLEEPVVINYINDAFSLLTPGGQLVFQIIANPISPVTRLSMVCRTAMFHCGVRSWRGWPTAPGFQRHRHTESFLMHALKDAGFTETRTVSASSACQWFVSGKPE